MARQARNLLHPLYRSLETSVHPLRYLFLEITQRCNLQCRHCGSDCSAKAHPNELSAGEWVAQLDAIARDVDVKQLLLVLTGGEPFCAPHLPQLLDAIKRHGMAFGMVTNGYALDARRLQQVVAAGCQSITISLDGLQESHDWLRGVDGSFARAVRAVELCTAGKSLPFFDVVTCVGPRNLHELGQVEELLRARHVPHWRLFCIFPRGRAKGDAELLLTDDQASAMFRFIAERRRVSPPEGMQIEFCCEGFLPAALDSAVRDEPYFCRAGISIASVLSDGSVTGCPNNPPALTQGNVREAPLKEIWEQRFTPFRDRAWMAQGPCQGCAAFKRCQGNSMHLWDADAQQPARCFRSISSSPGLVPAR